MYSGIASLDTGQICMKQGESVKLKVNVKNAKPEPWDRYQSLFSDFTCSTCYRLCRAKIYLTTWLA